MTASRDSLLRLFSVVLCMIVSLTIIIAPVNAEKPLPPPVSDAEQLASVIIDSDPFWISVDADTKLNLLYEDARQFYGGNASGLMMWVNDEVYGPSSIPAGNTFNAFTTVSNTLSGQGTPASPWIITTKVSAGDTGVSLESRLEYVQSDDDINFLTRVTNSSGQSKDITLFHAGDLYLAFEGNNPDYGYGTRRAATGAIGATTSSGDYAFLFEPVDPASVNAYQEAIYWEIWDSIGDYGSAGTGFDNTFRTDYHDCAAGLQWDFTVPASSSHTIAHRVRVESINIVPFYPRVDALNIANYVKTSTLSRRDFIDTFPLGGSCPDDGGACMLWPAAELWYTANFEHSGSGGLCYGFSLAATLFYRDINAPSEFVSNAETPFGISTLNEELDRHLGILHSYQDDWLIAKELNDVRSAHTPNGILDKLKYQINTNHNLNPYILVIYGESLNLEALRWKDSGHALVPYAIATDGTGNTIVSVYDSNHPGDVGRAVTFDTSNNTWAYHMDGQRRPAGDFNPGAGYWAGDSDDHLISLVPMSMHTEDHPRLPYIDLDGGGAWLAADSQGLADLLITDAYGNQLGTDENGVFHNEIDGAIPVIPMDDTGEGEGHQFYLPAGSFDARLNTGSDTPVSTEFQYIGDGFAFSAQSLEVTSSFQDSFQFNTQSNQMELSSGGTNRGIDMTYAFSHTMIHIQGIELGANNEINAGFDESTDQFTLDNSMGDSKTYNLSMNFYDLSTFTLAHFHHPNINLEANATHILSFANTEETQTVELGIDRNSNGQIDDTASLDNVFLVNLPVVLK
jgi:hypothetical protein